MYVDVPRPRHHRARGRRRRARQRRALQAGGRADHGPLPRGQPGAAPLRCVEGGRLSIYDVCMYMDVGVLNRFSTPRPPLLHHNVCAPAQSRARSRRRRRRSGAAAGAGVDDLIDSIRLDCVWARCDDGLDRGDTKPKSKSKIDRFGWLARLLRSAFKFCLGQRCMSMAPS